MQKLKHNFFIFFRTLIILALTLIPIHCDILVDTLLTEVFTPCKNGHYCYVKFENNSPYCSFKVTMDNKEWILSPLQTSEEYQVDMIDTSLFVSIEWYSIEQKIIYHDCGGYFTLYECEDQTFSCP